MVGQVEQVEQVDNPTFFLCNKFNQKYYTSIQKMDLWHSGHGYGMVSVGCEFNFQRRHFSTFFWSETNCTWSIFWFQVGKANMTHTGFVWPILTYNCMKDKRHKCNKLDSNFRNFLLSVTSVSASLFYGLYWLNLSLSFEFTYQYQASGFWGNAYLLHVRSFFQYYFLISVSLWLARPVQLFEYFCWFHSGILWRCRYSVIWVLSWWSTS